MADMRTRDPTPRSSTSEAAHKDADRSAFSFHHSATGVDSTKNESIPDLVRQLAEQGSQLAQQQVELMQAEVRSSIADLKQAAGAMAGAAVLGLAGLGVTLMGVAFMVAQVMPVWAATLLVGIASLAVAYALYATASTKMKHSSIDMDRTRRTLERAPEAISGTTKQGHHHGR